MFNVGIPSHLKTLEAEISASLSEYESSARIDHRLFASGSGLCSRAAVLDATKEGDHYVGAAQKIYMELGNSIEDILIKAMKKRGMILFSQYRLPEIGINIGGRVDAIILFEGKVFVLEIKSCGKLPSTPSLSHQAQASIYAQVLGLPAKLLYFSRNVTTGFNGDLAIKSFDVDVAGEVYQNALKKAIYARLAINRRVLPDKLPDKKGCDYCNYFSNCWNGVTFREKYEPVEYDEHLEIMSEVTKLYDDILTPEKVRDRRVGVFNFIANNGEDSVKTLLKSSNWESFL